MTEAQRGSSTLADRPLDDSPTGAPAGDQRELCVCGHVAKTHDKVAARYCAATAAGHIERGCLCEKPAGPTPRY